MSLAHPLFGGALTITVPADLYDASRMREVPDNQEVFVDTAGQVSLIVEIVEMPEEEPSIEYYFHDLADETGSHHALVRTTRELAENGGNFGAQRSRMSGEHRHRDKDGNETTRYLHMELLRLPQYASDILATISYEQGRPTWSPEAVLGSLAIAHCAIFQ